MGSQDGLYAPPFLNPLEKTVNVDGTDYHPNASETDGVSTYTGLDDYDTLFAARHGRGALDQVPIMNEQMIMTTSMGITSPIASTGLMVNPLERVMPTCDIAHSSQREQASIPKDSLKHRVVSPSSEIIGEGAAIFTNMMETILNILDQQMAMTPDTQQSKGLSPIDNQMKGIQGGNTTTSDQKESYSDLFLPLVENYKTSDHFCGYSDSLSTDNNPMVLVELKNLSYQYGTSVYAVDRVNITMYVKFSVGYKIIPEKAMVIPQFQQTPVEDEYRPTYENTLPGITDIATPMAKSTPVMQASQMPVLMNVPLPERYMVEPMSSERARTAYLECQIQDMRNVRLPLNIPSMEDELHAPTDLSNRIRAFSKEWKEKRKHEWESIRVALDKMKDSKGKYQKQQVEEERDVAYSQMVKNIERMRDIVRGSRSRASTISAEERQLALTEDDFSVIKKKMDKIDQRLHDLYRN